MSTSSPHGLHLFLHPFSWPPNPWILLLKSDLNLFLSSLCTHSCSIYALCNGSLHFRQHQHPLLDLCCQTLSEFTLFPSILSAPTALPCLSHSLVQCNKTLRCSPSGTVYKQPHTHTHTHTENTQKSNKHAPLCTHFCTHHVISTWTHMVKYFICNLSAQHVTNKLHMQELQQHQICASKALF